MGQRMIERRLRETSDRLRRLREELRIVDEQLAHLSDEADDLGLRALVSETPGASVEYREARLHADAMRARPCEHVERVARDLVDGLVAADSRDAEQLDVGVVRGLC